MLTILIFTQIVFGIVLIGIILVQKGKGADMGVSFGAGASETLFGASGSVSFLAKVTWGLAFLFMLNSLSISYIIYHSKDASLIKAQPQKTHIQIPATPLPDKNAPIKK